MARSTRSIAQPDIGDVEPNVEEIVENPPFRKRQPTIKSLRNTCQTWIWHSNAMDEPRVLLPWEDVNGFMKRGEPTEVCHLQGGRRIARQINYKYDTLIVMSIAIHLILFVVRKVVVKVESSMIENAEYFGVFGECSPKSGPVLVRLRVWKAHMRCCEKERMSKAWTIAAASDVFLSILSNPVSAIICVPHAIILVAKIPRPFPFDSFSSTKLLTFSDKWLDATASVVVRLVYRIVSESVDLVWNSLCWSSPYICECIHRECLAVGLSWSWRTWGAR